MKVSNSSDPDQDRHSVGPDLGPSYLQCRRQKLPLARKEINLDGFQLCWFKSRVWYFFLRYLFFPFCGKGFFSSWCSDAKVFNLLSKCTE